MKSYPVARSLLTEQLKKYAAKTQSEPIAVVSKCIANDTFKDLARSSPIDIPQGNVSFSNHSESLESFDSFYASFSKSFDSVFSSLGLSK